MSNEERTYRTQVEGKGGQPFAVSPDGTRLLFSTGRIFEPLRLLDLRNGKIEPVPLSTERGWDNPAWSPDGQQVAVVSTGKRDKLLNLDDMQLVLLDARTWQSHVLTSGPGVKRAPFFSADGKSLYYFQGKPRDIGRTQANDYDLYAIDIVTRSIQRLTTSEFYSVSPGYDDGRTVLFSGDSRNNPRNEAGNTENALFLYDRVSKRLSHLPIDQSSGLFAFSYPLRDQVGRLYFVSTKYQPERGARTFVYWLTRAEKDGKRPELLVELPWSRDGRKIMSYHIAANTGEIYVVGEEGKEILFRRLSTHEKHQPKGN